eukprot:TRINITY_DN9535_c0_g3_i1.p1 TRINITY_DN9535_c0_g3~~TRINITY_DN9535_c0_g3_i1.p1  ORF type:complete len:192 (+),score=57.69 TRINITY_DN9535_c0_g3_i1:92-667(+)
MEGGKKGRREKSKKDEADAATAEKEPSDSEEEKSSKLIKEDKFDDISSAVSKSTKATKHPKRETKKGEGKRKRRKKLTGDSINPEDKARVLNYMKEQNRPYSALNVFDNLHGEIKKTEVQRILDVLVEEGEVKSKDFGKFVIYLFNQDKMPVVSKDEIEKTDKEINDHKEKLKALTDKLKEKQKSTCTIYA